MKIGILTFPHSPSLGAMLQMGSLYHAVQALGHDVEIINYVSDSVNHRQPSPQTIKSTAIRIISKVFLKSAAASYREFESGLSMFPKQPVHTFEDLQLVSDHFDRIIVGSDQVWNPVVTGHDLNFYLPFCSAAEKKASYAASFGYQQADQEHEAEIAALLKDFSDLSVRERDGQRIIKDLTGRDAALVLDPTLLVSDDFLRSMMEKTMRKKKYVLFFCIKPSPELYASAQAYAHKHSYELVTVGGRIKDRFNPTKHPVYGTGPKEFLGLVDGAQCVFTNSFHGMAISIALQTDFYVSFSSDTNSRLANLTELLHLQDRVIGSSVPAQRPIDYRNVDLLLARERECSWAYLKNVLTEH